MKTINWNEAPKEATHYMPEGEIFCAAWVKDLNGKGYSYIIIGDELQEWDTANFSQPKYARSFLIERPNSNPVYTQEMHEAGELPGVGAKFKVVAVETDFRIFDFKDKEVEVIGLSKNGVNDVITFSHPVVGIGCGNYDHCWIEPLESPVKLVDGKAYLVTHKGNGHEYEVLYRKATDSFFSSKIDHPSRFFTNIQPLTVEK